MDIFLKAMAGGFAGKLVATLFIAVCLAFGFGPDKWATFVIGQLPITPGMAQWAFLVLATATAFHMAWPFIARLRTTNDPGPSISVTVNDNSVWFDGLQSVASLSIRNNSPKVDVNCLAQIEQLSGQKPEEMPLPLVLRTDGQIRGARNGEFTLRRTQPKTIPVIFRRKERRNEWYLFDEHGKRYFTPAEGKQFLIGIYGGETTEKALLTVDLGADWTPSLKLTMVPDDYRLEAKLVRARASSAASPLIAAMVNSDRGRVTFDYSTNNGVVSVGQNDHQFRLAFSKSGASSIHLMTSSHSSRSNLKKLARVKGAKSGDLLRFHEYDSSSAHYTIHTGEHFLAENGNEYFMQGRITGIKDDSRGAERDEITFDFEINTNGSSEFMAI